MGICSSKRKLEGDGEPTIVRLSPFRPRRCSSLRRRSSHGGAPAAPDAGPLSLLALAADALAASLHRQTSQGLARLPADLSQLLLERLVAQACGGVVGGLGRPAGAHVPLQHAWLDARPLQHASSTAGTPTALAANPNIVTFPSLLPSSVPAGPPGRRRHLEALRAGPPLFRAAPGRPPRARVPLLAALPGQRLAGGR